MEKDYSISFIRFFSMLLIIICHIMQYYGDELAWWFNVGVQVFLIISGYLYAQKKIKNKKEFYNKQLKKILIPYYIYIVIISILYLLIGNKLINKMILLKTLIFIDEIKGLEHLWFIRYILVCYIALPLFQKIISGKNNIIKIIILLFFNEVIGLVTNNFLNGTWLNCFVVGMLLHIYHNYINARASKVLIYIISILFNSIEILFKYVLNVNFTGILRILFNKYCNIGHLLLGVIIFITLRKIYEIYFQQNSINKILNITDKYSFYIYVTHHVFILGPLSIYKYLNSPIFSTIVMLIITILSAFILKKVSEIFYKKITG